MPVVKLDMVAIGDGYAFPTGADVDGVSQEQPLAVSGRPVATAPELAPNSALSARGISNCNREDLGKRWPT
jgi:hypothetical protein